MSRRRRLLDGRTSLRRFPPQRTSHRSSGDGRAFASDNPVYRERVYCYELYHQMRLLWPLVTPYCLNGEIDKNSHPYFRYRKGGKPKPDLLVHQPGFDRHNHAVIEIKSVAGHDIKKDLETLSLFRKHPRLRYERAIYLIYGTGADNRLAVIKSVAARARRLAPIEVWLHAAPSTPAQHLHMLMPPPQRPRRPRR